MAKGRFIPKNPAKYLGNPERIIFRSGWELRLFRWLDSTPAVLQWASEEFSIPYLHPFDGKIHQYYPDALVIYKDKYGNLQKEIVEVKPYKETVLTPRATDRDKLALAVNMAKWKFAADFAATQGLKFRVITEKSMFQHHHQQRAQANRAPVRRSLRAAAAAKTGAA
jgi:hypothetical protein